MRPNTPCQLMCPVINIAMSIYFKLLSCALYTFFFSNNARFSYTDICTRLHYYSEKKIRVRLECILLLYRNHYFKAFLRQNIQQKLGPLVLHSVLLGACP